MSKHPSLTAELLRLCGQMRDQTITPADAQRLNTLLAENKSARQFYLQFMSLTAGLETHEAETAIDATNTDSGTDVNLLMDLLRMEEQAHADLVHVAKPPRFKRLKKPSNDPSWSKLMDRSLLLYIAGQAARTKPAKWLAAAAVVALCVLIAIQFIGPATAPTTNPITDNTPPKPAESAPPILRDQTVATLSAARDARWDTPAGTFAPTAGDALRSGQRLTLTAGFAEITTNDGAVAIIQAPATIELIDNDNALHLHDGKLLGICETDSSKGFLVRTPHMDVIDLGTRFGIDASRWSSTEVHVLEGEVQAVHTDASAGTKATHLLAGQSAHASEEESAIARIDHDADRFTALMPEAIWPAGVSDWQIVAVNGQALDTPGAMKVAKHTDGSPWITADRGYPEQANDETTFTVQTRFDVPADVDGGSATLLLQFDANDRVTQVRLNGKAYIPPVNSKNDGHDGMHTMRIDGPLLAGQNTLQLDVVDVRRNNSSKWELRVAWSIEPTQNTTGEVSQ